MMDKFERGKRAEISLYDDAWIRGDDGIELIESCYCDTIQELGLTKEQMDKFIDEFNSIEEYSFPAADILFYYAHTELTNEIDRRDLENSFECSDVEGDEK